MIAVGAGLVIDTSSMANQDSRLQAKIDAAVLAAAVFDKDDKDEVKKFVEDYLQDANDFGVTLTADVLVDDENIKVTAAIPYAPLLMGNTTRMVRATTEAPRRQEQPLNIALVLDTTQSMEDQGNMRPMQNAAKTLLQDLSSFTADVKVSIVPFGDYVKVAPDPATVPGWIRSDAPAWIDASTHGTVVTRCKPEIVKTGSCVGTGTYNNFITYSDGIPSGTTSREVMDCSGRVSRPTGNTICTSSPAIWGGCAGSRARPYNTQADFGGRRIPGAMNVTCGTEMMPLTDDFAAAETMVESLTASGNTYLPSGLMWGWRSITPSAPFTEATSSSRETIKAVVFMTDGANTLSQDGDLHDGEDKVEGLKMTENICEGMRTDSVQVYTVAYKFVGDPADMAATRAVLQNCASSTANYFEAANARQLKDAFKDISRQLFSVRLSR